ncbi:MAG TPA: ABC transporter ATP-binding protein [Chryseosolibacter sp.]|nr:ABC transporter ATP-binding protein [Chryseosolibacter sp.]
MIADLKPVVTLDNVVIGFRENGRILFENINLALWPGRLVCLMGRNGVGKSSLIRSIAGLQKLIAGKIAISETSDNREIPKQISTVLTERASVANMQVYEFVSFGRYPYIDWKANLSEPDHEKIRASLSKVGIVDLQDSNVSTLSDGQMQMVMIARALVQDTPIILLDEPTAHLDLNHRLEVMKLLKSLTRELNKAILISTHELDLALQVADEIWLAGSDKTISPGIPEDLVLNGSFDHVFQFKGFDLKSGKFHHAPFRDKPIVLIGESHAFLWTKNALERNGFKVVTRYDASENHRYTVTILDEEGKISWLVDDNLKQPQKTFSIENLLSIVCALPE